MPDRDEVEAVARALWTAFDAPLPKRVQQAWEAGSEMAKDAMRVRAKAAITALDAHRAQGR